MLKEPKNMPIPSKEDYFFDGELDEKWALRHYLGKDIDFAEQRYYAYDPLTMLDDFTLVGVKAFRYYIFAAFRYLQNEHSKGEPDVYAALPDTLAKKISEDPAAFKPIARYIVDFSLWAIYNYNKFGIAPYAEIYGDVKTRYWDLKNKAESLLNADC